MKKITIVLISILFFSCSEKKKNSLKYVKHNIEFLNWNLNIPENYMSISFEEYNNIITESFSDSTMISNKIKNMEVLTNNISEHYVFFCDKNNIENTFLLTSMLNPIPNRYFKDQLARELHSDFRNKGEVEGYTYKAMENKLINKWLIKIKGEKKYPYPDKSIYNTIYFSNNFGAFVTSTNKDLDFEKEMTE
tara:strand:+ start:56650 stop:57225 length:576 start_codon:yes stop_codon:yes gene_type:complete